jgi:hypothetical protein
LNREQGKVTQNLTGKRGRFFQKYKVTNAREVVQLIETSKLKVKAEAQRIRGYRKGDLNMSKIRCLRKTTKNFTEIWARRI